jgi:hypothetical protein
MTKNKKGFVLVESIVAAIFVMAFTTFLIANMLPLVGEYEKSLKFDTVDSKYDAHLVRKMFLMDDACRVDQILYFNDSDFSGGRPKFYYFPGDEICDYLTNQNYCRKLLSEDFLDVKEIVVTEYTGSSLKHADGDYKYDLSNEIQEYIKFMPVYGSGALSFYKIQDRLIISFGDGRVTNLELLKNYTNSDHCTG